MLKIKKVEVTPIDRNIGKIVDSTQTLDDKTKNTYSMRVIDEKNVPGNAIANTRLGDNALTKFELSESDLTLGTRNTALGKNALSENTTGHHNTAVGFDSLALNTTGYYNTALGVNSLWSNTTGEYNTAIGGGSLNQNTTGTSNTALGVGSLANNTTGINNTAVGRVSLDSNTTGYENVAIGVNSLWSNTEGHDNTAIGTVSLQQNTTGNYNTAIGSQAGYNNTTYNNTTSLGYNAQVTGDNQVQLGNSSTSVYAYSSVNVRSDKRDKKDIENTDLGLDFIKKLRPVKYKWNFRNGEYEGKRYHQGLIAQEVKKVLDDMKTDFAGYQDHKVNGGEDVLSLAYGEFIAPLIKAIQEQQVMIDDLKKQVEKLS